MDKQKQRKSLLTFYKYESWCLRLMAIWRLKGNCSQQYRYLHNIHFYGVFIFCILSFDISCLTQLLKHITDLNEVIKVFFMFATSLAVLVKFISIKRNNHLYQFWLEMIHAETFRPANTREEELFEQAVQQANIVRNLYVASSLLALMNVLRYRDNELPLSIYIPFAMEEGWRYFAVYLYQCIAVCSCCCVNIGFDSFATSALIHLKGQLDILRDRLQTLNLNSSLNNSAHPGIVEQLKNCVKFYDEILKLAHLVENLISVPISVQIACSVLVLVASLYALSIQSDPGDYANFIKVLTYQLCMLMQIYILCYYPGEVTACSDLVSYALYSSNWFGWTKRERKFALLLLYRFDVPIQFRSINPTYTFNVAVFSSIINSSYSYFALLKRVNN